VSVVGVEGWDALVPVDDVPVGGALAPPVG
jgi:hypothetical protein